MSRVTPAEYLRLVRQQEAKQKRAVDEYNRQVRQRNHEVKQAINKYNREVGAYNAKVRAHRQRLKTELTRMASAASRPQYVSLRTSVEVLHRQFVFVEATATSGVLGERGDDFLELSERETANSVAALNALTQDPTPGDAGVDLESTTILPCLSEISDDLGARWQGAVFALSPRNPDAARHFCTSAREILTSILDIEAPDPVVVAADPACERTQHGTPSRRSKIQFFLRRKGMADQGLEDFVEADLSNVLELFHVFNSATHGQAGRFDLPRLAVIRQRVEDAIGFLHGLVR